ncbi:MAG: CHAT domain-containing protein [Cyanothece sp. SIO2G6]|nr:CHAT domain-containing protein [Cyanothece sp. SIO2G6]
MGHAVIREIGVVRASAVLATVALGAGWVALGYEYRTAQALVTDAEMVSTTRATVTQHSISSHTEADELLAECRETLQHEIVDTPGEWARKREFVSVLLDCQERLEGAIATYQSLNNQESEAKALLMLGYAYERFSYYHDYGTDDFSREQRERGDAALREALAFYQESDNWVQQATALHLLAAFNDGFPLYDEAAPEFLEEAIALYQRLDAENVSRDNDTQLAIRFRSLRTFEDVLLRPDETSWDVLSAEALRHVGIIGRERAEFDKTTAESQYDQAIATFQQAATIAESVNHLPVAAEALFELGITYREINQESQAAAAFEQAIALTRNSKGPWAAAKILSNLAQRYAHQGSTHTLEQAIAYAQRSLTLYQDLDALHLQAEILSDIGHYYAQQQFYNQAFEFQMQAINTANQITDPSIRERTWSNLNWANLGFQNSAPEKALQLEQRELEIYQEWGDLARQARSLQSIGHIHITFLNQYKEALDTYQDALAIYQQLEDLPQQASVLSQLAELYVRAAQRTEQTDELESPTDEYELARQFYQQSIDLYLESANTEPDLDTQREQLYELAERILNIFDYGSYADEWLEDLKFHQQAVDLYRRLGDDEAVADVLSQMATALLSVVASDRANAFSAGITPEITPEITAKYEQSVALHNEALSLYRAVYQPLGEQGEYQLEIFLQRLPRLYINAGAYDQAIQFSQSHSQLVGHSEPVLKTLKAIMVQARGQRAAVRFPNVDFNDLTPEIETQPTLTPEDIADYQSILAYQQQALAIAHQLNQPYEQAILLAEIGYIHRILQQPDQAFSSYQQSLAIAQEPEIFYSDYPRVEGLNMIALGRYYERLGQFDGALQLYEKAIAFIQSQNDPALEADFISSFESNPYDYEDPNEREKWFTLYHRAVELYRELGDLNEASLALYRIGYAYKELEQYDRAVQYLEQAVQVIQALEEKPNTAEWYYRNLGEIMIITGQYERSLDYFNQEIAFHQEKGDRRDQLLVLDAIATLYLEADQANLARQFHQQYLELFHTQGTLAKELTTLIKLGQQYQDHNQLEAAFEFYQQALALGQLLETDPNLTDADWSGMIFGRLGSVFREQGQTELAIAFYKTAINRYEGIRASYIESSEEFFSEADFATIFLDKHIDDYRTLADLLLQQDRILEAQQVLDLLKVQELDDYLQDVQRSGDAAQGAMLRVEEQDVLDRFLANQDQLVALGLELRQLETLPRDQRTGEQSERVKELRQLQFDAKTIFQAWLESDEIQTLVATLRNTTGGTNLELAQLNGLQDNLKQLRQNAIALYPLVLEDRLELVIVTANAPPVNRTVPVRRELLNRTIAEFRSALSSPRGNVIPPARQLYNWLIRPIEADLAQAGVEVILYAPDAQLRYIPLAALHDGDQWLTQRFQVNNIVAATLVDINNQTRPANLNILAAAFTEGEYAVDTSTRTLAFGGLPFAGREVENLAQLMPQTEKRLDQQFDQSIIFEMNDYDVIHLATHASFNPGPAEDSFILFGDGSHASLESIKSWTFPDVTLVVLSACQTAVGDILGDGAEVLGLGYLMQNAGAEAAIASLWSVSDGGTQVLMDAFYAALNNGYSKTESLQRAQQALITGDETVLEGERGITVEILDSRSGDPLTHSSDLNHPYYWAPFILIGNGL